MGRDRGDRPTNHDRPFEGEDEGRGHAPQVTCVSIHPPARLALFSTSQFGLAEPRIVGGVRVLVANPVAMPDVPLPMAERELTWGATCAAVRAGR